MGLAPETAFAFWRQRHADPLQHGRSVSGSELCILDAKFKP